MYKNVYTEFQGDYMSELSDYLNTLEWRLENLKKEILDHQESIQSIYEQINIKQEQIKNITQLLAAEGITFNDPELAKITDMPIADLAYEFLKNDQDQKPYHYSVITKNLLSQGALIPGKNPAANLLTHISRDDRFVRTASGTYGLVEHGHKPAPKSKRKRKR